MDVYIFYAVVLAFLLAFMVREHRGQAQPVAGSALSGWRELVAGLAAMATIFVVSALILDPLLGGFDDWANARWLITAGGSALAGLLVYRWTTRLLARRFRPDG